MKKEAVETDVIIDDKGIIHLEGLDGSTTSVLQLGYLADDSSDATCPYGVRTQLIHVLD